MKEIVLFFSGSWILFKFLLEYKAQIVQYEIIVIDWRLSKSYMKLYLADFFGLQIQFMKQKDLEN
jgi:hypothetical protein